MHTAAHIGLASDTFHINEREGWQRFPINRSGSINGVNRILCKLKPINAMTQITGEDTADFIVPRTPEEVTFQASITTNCTYIRIMYACPWQFDTIGVSERCTYVCMLSTSLAWKSSSLHIVYRLHHLAER